MIAARISFGEEYRLKRPKVMQNLQDSGVEFSVIAGSTQHMAFVSKTLNRIVITLLIS
jgi:hypothetical protein